MAMHIAHSNIPDDEGGNRKRRSKRISASRWLARQRQKDHEKALKKYADRIAEIRKYFPGWMPVKKSGNELHR